MASYAQAECRAGAAKLPVTRAVDAKALMNAAEFSPHVTARGRARAVPDACTRESHGAGGASGGVWRILRRSVSGDLRARGSRGQRQLAARGGGGMRGTWRRESSAGVYAPRSAADAELLVRTFTAAAAAGVATAAVV